MDPLLLQVIPPKTAPKTQEDAKTGINTFEPLPTLGIAYLGLLGGDRVGDFLTRRFPVNRKLTTDIADFTSQLQPFQADDARKTWIEKDPEVRQAKNDHGLACAQAGLKRDTGKELEHADYQAMIDEAGKLEKVEQNAGRAFDAKKQAIKTSLENTQARLHKNLRTGRRVGGGIGALAAGLLWNNRHNIYSTIKGWWTNASEPSSDSKDVG